MSQISYNLLRLTPLQSDMAINLTLNEILEQLELHFPNAKSELVFQNSFELLVATILSAQCTDERVNKVTPILFEHYPTPEKLAQSTLEDVVKIIYSTGFYNNKAKNIIAMSKKLVEEFDSKVPSDMEKLVTLPGVARKTANVVLYNAFGICDGIAIDTHVKRIALLLGLSNKNDPEKIEQDLMKIIPKDKWGFFSQSIVLYGRYYCKAKRHDITKCFLGGHELLDDYNAY